MLRKEQMQEKSGPKQVTKWYSQAGAGMLLGMQHPRRCSHCSSSAAFWLPNPSRGFSPPVLVQTDINVFESSGGFRGWL